MVFILLSSINWRQNGKKRNKNSTIPSHYQYQSNITSCSRYVNRFSYFFYSGSLIRKPFTIPTFSRGTWRRRQPSPQPVHPSVHRSTVVCVCERSKASFSSFLPFRERTSLVKNGAWDLEVFFVWRLGSICSALPPLIPGFVFNSHPHFLSLFFAGLEDPVWVYRLTLGRSWRGFC